MQAGIPPRYLPGIRDFLLAGRALAAAYESAGEAIEDGDRSLRTKSMQTVAVAKAHFARVAAAHGIAYCGKGPDPPPQERRPKTPIALEARAPPPRPLALARS